MTATRVRIPRFRRALSEATIFFTMECQAFALSVARRRTFFALLSVAALLLKGCSKETEGAIADKSEDTPTLVYVSTFEYGSIEDRLKVHAELEAVERADVFPEVNGVVVKVLAREGDGVERGHPIVQLDDRELELTAKIKKVLWEQKLSNVQRAELAIRELEATLETKQLLVEKAKLEYERMAKLFSGAGGVVSKEEYDGKKYAFEEAAANERTEEIKLDKARVDHKLAEKAATQAGLEYQTSEFDRSRMLLKSPLAGRVSFLELKPGEYVSPAARVFAVVNPANLEARLFVPQRELQRLRVGQSVRIRSDVFPERSFEGVLEVINPTVDPVTGTVRVIVSVTDRAAAGQLKPGMFVSGDIILETRENTRLVSKKAVIFENQRRVLFLVEGEGDEAIARRYMVNSNDASTQGSNAATESVIEVRSLEDETGNLRTDIPVDARVVFQGHNNLKDGARVRVETRPGVNDE